MRVNCDYPVMKKSRVSIQVGFRVKAWFPSPGRLTDRQIE